MVWLISVSEYRHTIMKIENSYPSMIPLRATSILLDISSLLCHRRNDLSSAASISNYCLSFQSAQSTDSNPEKGTDYSLARVVDRMIPSCRVYHWALKIFHPWKLDIPRERNCPNSRDKYGRVPYEVETCFHIPQ